MLIFNFDCKYTKKSCTIHTFSCFFPIDRKIYAERPISDALFPPLIINFAAEKTTTIVIIIKIKK